MKFVKRFLILGLFALVGVSFCSASGDLIFHGTGNYITRQTNMDGFSNGKNLCINMINGTMHYDIGQGITQMSKYELYCFTGGSITLYPNNGTLVYNYVDLSLGCETCPIIDQNYCTSNNLCPSCPSCPSQYTSLECQTEYNLIPVSSVTENYCTSNFDLISPSDCPISSGTGDTQRSALFLNNVQYAGASNIYLNISDLLDYSTTYIDSGASFVLDVDGYVADTEYLDDILTVQQYHPDSEDFTSAFVGGLTLLLPYVVVILFVVFIWKLIKKVFKS